jgi:hypothetical protein
MGNENQSLGAKVGSFVDGLLGALGAKAPATGDPETPKAAQAEITLRYGLQSKIIPATEDVLDSTVGDLFDDHAEDLGLPSTGSFGIRSAGEPVEESDRPQAGRTYTATAARENKGN